MERPRERRAPVRPLARWAWVALLAGVAAALAWIALVGAPGRAAGPIGAAPPDAEPAAPGRAAPAALAPATATEVQARDAAAPARSRGIDEGRLALLVVPPPEWPLTTPVVVTVRRASGEHVRELHLPADAPRAEFVLAHGEYLLEGRHAGPPELACPPLALAVDGDAAEDVRLALVPARVLGGTVVDEVGRAVADVPLALELGGRPVAAARTGPDGGFTFPPLPEGEYELVVGDPLGPLVPRRPTRVEAALALLEVVVPPLHEMVVRVVDEQGRALSDVEVEGLGADGGRVAGVTDARGELHARGLPPGAYRLFARDPVLGRGTRVVELSSSPSAPIEVRLVPRR